MGCCLNNLTNTDYSIVRTFMTFRKVLSLKKEQLMAPLGGKKYHIQHSLVKILPFYLMDSVVSP